MKLETMCFHRMLSKLVPLMQTSISRWVASMVCRAFLPSRFLDPTRTDQKIIRVSVFLTLYTWWARRQDSGTSGLFLCGFPYVWGGAMRPLPGVRSAESKRRSALLSIGSPQMARVARLGLAVPSLSPAWLSGSQVLWPSSNVFPSTFSGNWPGNRVARTKTGAVNIGCWV